MTQERLFDETTEESARRLGWISPVCVVTPRQLRNHTACDYSLCQCRCHKGSRNS